MPTFVEPMVVVVVLLVGGSGVGVVNWIIECSVEVDDIVIEDIADDEGRSIDGADVFIRL